MLQRAFYSTIAAILLSATLVQTASAYPTTTRTATSTVTGAYRPLDFNFTLKDGTDSLDYTFDVTGSLNYKILFDGTFKSVGHPVTYTGYAGDWELKLGNNFADLVFASNTASSLFLTTETSGLLVGTLTYKGGLLVDGGVILPADETPVVNDFFRLYSTQAGTVLRVDCSDGTTDCNNFSLTLLQELEHLGPYVSFTINTGSGPITQTVLDVGRVNEECLVRGDDNEVVAAEPCGSLFPLVATGFNRPSAVPEPATLALIGLGLLGLGLSRRVRTR